MKTEKEEKKKNIGDWKCSSNHSRSNSSKDFYFSTNTMSHNE